MAWPPECHTHGHTVVCVMMYTHHSLMMKSVNEYFCNLSRDLPRFAEQGPGTRLWPIMVTGIAQSMQTWSIVVQYRFSTRAFEFSRQRGDEYAQAATQNNNLRVTRLGTKKERVDVEMLILDNPERRTPLCLFRCSSRTADRKDLVSRTLLCERHPSC